MSTPARKLATPRPYGHGMPGVPGGAEALRRPNGAQGAKRPLRSRARPATTPKRSRHKRHHLGFAIFASTLVGLMVFAIVVLHVLLAQQSFRIDAAERRLEVLDQEHLGLVREEATQSAPGRIVEWASRHGMRLPDDIRILRAPDGPVDPAGAGTDSEDEA